MICMSSPSSMAAVASIFGLDLDTAGQFAKPLRIASHPVGRALGMPFLADEPSSETIGPVPGFLLFSVKTKPAAHGVLRKISLFQSSARVWFGRKKSVSVPCRHGNQQLG